MTPSDKLRELAELFEKAKSEDEHDFSDFRDCLARWYREGGKELAEDGLRYRWLRESGHTFANEHERNRYCKAFDAGIDEAITKDTHAQEES